MIKPGLDTGEVIARFEAERQALALMDHPNIARVLDAGTTASGRPYFVMELVQGVPMTRYCDAHRVPLRERLELFLPVCRAIQHAHQKGIIHRDLKPSNILIALRDDKPVPKVIDFGIAKATTQRLTERTLHTRHGQLIGTPDYMSPEQAGLGGLDVDTRSDVYSLGAVLYELLCGDTPLGRARLKQLDYVSMLSVIYEEEPPTPSRRVTELGEKASDLARRRDVELPKLTQSLRGELDWIVTRALEKERTRRYESASALAADIERHLANEPVEACPPSKVYRMQKFVRRNRAALAAAATIALVLVGGIIASTWQAVRARRAERDMAVERMAAVGAKDEAERLLGVVDKERQEAEDARKEADDSRQEAQTALAQATKAAESERAAREEIALRLRVADAMRLAMQSKDVREQFPQRALLLAAEAVQATRRSGEPTIPAAEQALRDALASIGGRPLLNDGVNVDFMHVTQDGQTLVTGTNQVRVWDIGADDPVQSTILIGEGRFRHRSMAVSPNGQRLVTLDFDDVLHLWDLQARTLDAPVRALNPANLGRPEQLQFSADAGWLAASFRVRTLVWDLNSEESDQSPISIGHNDYPFRKFAFGADNRWFVTYDESSDAQNVCLWSLQSGASPSPQILLGKDDWIRGVQVSPDGRWLAAVGQSSQTWLKLWDLTADDPRQSMREVPQSMAGILPLNDIALYLTPDVRHLITTQYDNISLWPLSAEAFASAPVTLSLRESQLGRPSFVSDVVVDRSGRSLVAVNFDGTIFRWNLAARDPQGSRIIVGRDPGRTRVLLKISPSGRWLVSTGYNGAPRLWDLSAEIQRAGGGLLMTGHDGGVSGIEGMEFGGGANPVSNPGEAWLAARGEGASSVSNSGERWLVTRGGDAKLRLWDLAADDPSRAGVGSGTLQFWGSGVAEREDGQWVIDSGLAAQIVDPNNAMKPVSAEISINPPQGGQYRWYGDATLSNDGRWLAINHAEELSVWDLTDEKLLAESTGEGKGVLHRFWNLNFSRESGTASMPYKILKAPPNEPFVRVALSPDGRWIFTEGGGQPSQLWRLAADDLSDKPINLGESKLAPVFSPDGRWLVAFGPPPEGLFGRIGRQISTIGRRIPVEPQEMFVWDLAADAPLPNAVDLGQRRFLERGSVSFSNDGRWLAAGLRGEVRLWQLGDAGPVGEPEVFSDDDDDTEFSRTCLSGDGRWLAATKYPAEVHVWDRSAENDNRRHHVLRGHDQRVHALAFSHDHQWLATAAADGQVRLWNLQATLPEETTIVLPTADGADSSRAVERLLFSHDGKWLAASGGETVHFWPLELDRLLRDAFRLAGRELDTLEIARYRLDANEVHRGRLLRQAEQIANQFDADPKDSSLLIEQALLLGCAGKLREAADGLTVAVRLQPDNHELRYWLLPLLVETGQADQYRRHCEEMWARFQQTDRPEIYERAAKGALLWPEAGFEVAKAVALADKALTAGNGHPFMAYFQATKALAEYRLGNNEAALEWAEKCLAYPTGAFNREVPALAVVVMARARLGQPDEARTALDDATSFFATIADPVDGRQLNLLHDWLICKILLREAEAVLTAPP